MQAHDEERDIYGVVYAQGRKYFLLEKEPTWKKPTWVLDGTRCWLVADDQSIVERDPNNPDDFVWVHTASYIVFGTDVLIELFPVPLSTKVIRFYVTDDEEA